MKRSKRMMFSEFFMLRLPETGVTGLAARLRSDTPTLLAVINNVIAA